MIKRRFYRQDHGDRDAASASASSSDDDDSDSTPEVEEEEEEVEEEEEEVEQEQEEEEGEEIGRAKGDKEPLLPSSGSGYESEDSSGNEVDGYTSGLLVNEEKEGSDRGHEKSKDDRLNNEVDVQKKEKVKTGGGAIDSNDPIQADLDSCILKYKSVFKCRLCPRILCLNEETVKQHLKSKRHARSKKLLGEGRLKLRLNSDGEIEEEQETHAERHARTVALAQDVDALKKKDTGRQRQSHRRKKRLRKHSDKQKSEQLAEKPTKKKREAED